jgi:hypothetical protein
LRAKSSACGELNNVDYVSAVNTDPDFFKDYDTYDFDTIFLGNNVLEIISPMNIKAKGGCMR